MSKLQAALDEYLSVHRALGYKLRLSGRLLQRFVDFADREGAAYITSELALTWATQPAAAQVFSRESQPAYPIPAPAHAFDPTVHRDPESNTQQGP